MGNTVVEMMIDTGAQNSAAISVNLLQTPRHLGGLFGSWKRMYGRISRKFVGHCRAF